MAKLKFDRLFSSADLPLLRRAVAELQEEPGRNGPGPEIVAERPWDTLDGRPKVLVTVEVFGPEQAFLLGLSFAKALLERVQKGGPADA